MPTEHHRTGTAPPHTGCPPAGFSTRVVPVPGRGPYAVAEDADGALWVTLAGSGQIAELNDREPPRLHSAGRADARPTVVAAGPDGRTMWFTEFLAGRVVGVRPGRTPVRVPLPAGDEGPYGVTAGPDGAVWFTELTANRIGRLVPAGGGHEREQPYAVQEFTLPVSGGCPAGITAGPDGGLWFALSGADAIGRIGPGGAVTVHRLPSAGARPVHIAAGADGAMWFTQIGVGRVGRITADGQIDEVPLPGGPATRPHGVAAAAGGGCWFTEWGTCRIGRVDASGRVSTWQLPPGVSEPHGIAATGAGTVWAAMESGALVGLTPD
ncbi:virginiamycin B lyase [Streptomyces sp. WMMB 714]|uniref:Vgb family protein n=1 Tax=Streptomyces sp. WMMB 714 TaxID=1286822 RepID=UPI0008238F54|nr:virginiamycin B lyase [Streptomyces sp. WMMB 714]SCK31560.1 virginiamycin B lyase [Streptomyces sp. WMMB 714]